MSRILQEIERTPATHTARNDNAARIETRADLYQRASAEAFAALQQAAIDALDTLTVIDKAVALLEASRTLDPDERTTLIAVLQTIPAVRMERAAQQQKQEGVPNVEDTY